MLLYCDISNYRNNTGYGILFIANLTRNIYVKMTIKSPVFRREADRTVDECHWTDDIRRRVYIYLSHSFQQWNDMLLASTLLSRLLFWSLLYVFITLCINDSFSICFHSKYFVRPLYSLNILIKFVLPTL